MKFYINDFSFQSVNNTANHRSLMETFIDVCERAQSFKFEQLYMPDDYKIREIASGLTFVSFIDSAEPKDSLKMRLRSLLTNQIKKMSEDEVDDKIQYVCWNDTESDFFKKAHNRKSPVASFRTHFQFDNDNFSVTSQILNDDDTLTTSEEVIINLSNSAHFQVHNHYLTSKLLEQSNNDRAWNALREPLRFPARINQYLADIGFFDKLNGNGDVNYKRALFFDVGSAIAEMSGWSHDNRVSRINSTPARKRKVFFARNPTGYLSIDFMHGTFELHDRNGAHIGEYNFNGVDLNSTYADGSHNIRV